MRNYNSSGDVLKTTATADHASGELVKVGSIVGYTVDAVESGGIVVIKTEGVFEQVLPTAFEFGDPVFWDGTDFLTDAGEDIVFIGFCVGPNLLKLSAQWLPPVTP